MKKPSIVKYVMLGMLMFYFAVLVAVVTRMVLVQDNKWLLFSDEQAGLVTSMIEGAVGAVAAGFVLYQLKVEEKMVARENDIQEAQFILEYNQAFIQDAAMCAVEQRLERWMEGKLPDSEVVSDENRQSLINYLVYLEGLAPLVFRGVLTLEHIDDLMAYRFFLAVNNPVVQADQLFAYPDYYRGCFKLHKLWKEFRLRRGYPVLLDQSGLDRWMHYGRYIADEKTVVRPMFSDDDLKQAAGLLYDTDPYIYPAMFGTRQKAKTVLSRWLAQGNGMFRVDNMILAEEDGHIVGVLLYADGTRKENHTLRMAPGDKLPAASEDVCRRYFDDVFARQSEDIYVSCVSVDPAHSGRHIASRMLRCLIERFPDRQLRLDVLEGNEPAIHVYQKAGFRTVSQGPGYAYGTQPENCLHMVRLPGQDATI